MHKTNRLVNLLLLFLFSLFFYQDVYCSSKPQPDKFTILSLENEPRAGGIAVLKITAYAPEYINQKRIVISCFLPDGLRLVNDKNYQSIRRQLVTTKEWGNDVVFYSGPIEANKKKELIFKLYVPDEKKYLLTPIGGDSLEIDLGDPEPPELSYYDKNDTIGMKNGKVHVKTRIKELKGGETTEFTIPKDTLPPLRTELRIRTKEKPYVHLRELIYSRQPGKDRFIPFRYLVYTEEEAPEVKVTLSVPEGLEIVQESQPYAISSGKEGRQETVLYQGPMRFKQCRALYFKLKVPLTEKKEYPPVVVTTQVTTSDGRKLLREDKELIDLGSGRV